jgi:hypothetical protein
MRCAIPLLVPLLALLTTACGGEEQPQATPASSPAATRPSPTPEPTPTAEPAG